MTTKREAFLAGVCATLGILIVAVACLGAGASRQNVYDRPYRCLISEPSDAALTITWDLAGIDDPAATIADMTTAIAAAKVVLGRRRVWAQCRVAGATDTVEVTPIFRHTDGTVAFSGDTLTLKVANTTDKPDENGHYMTEWQPWRTNGEYDVIFHVNCTSGTFHRLWTGTTD